MMFTLRFVVANLALSPVMSTSIRVDYLVFQQEWPESYCIHHHMNHCHIGKEVNTWIVHGLWPEGPHSADLNYCHGKSECLSKFNVSVLMGMENKLKKYWPDLHEGGSLLWKKEWCKHGTCTVDRVPGIRTVQDYFRAALKLNRQLDLVEILKRNGIVPREDGYDVIHLLKSLKGMLVHCFTNRRHKQYILSVDICLDLRMNLIHCPLSRYSNQDHSCEDFLPVLYPKIRHDFD